jgi:DNA polymerase-3 subunit epsilon
VRHLVLARPIVFLDLETTGPNPAIDRIVELSMIRVRPGGDRDALTRRVNPGVPIPAEATQVHGITDADVAGAPRFAAIAAEVVAFIGEADLAGFNVQRFDLPVLHRELATAGTRLDMTGRAVVDAQVFYNRRVPRDLAAAFAPREVEAVDPEGRFVWKGDEAVVAFGPDGIRGRPLREVAAKDRGFLEWVLRRDFTPQVKAIVQAALAGRFPARRPPT